MPCCRRRSPARDDGFTLVEILIAIVLVGILSAVVVVGVGNLTSKGSSAACTSSLDAARTGLMTHLTATGSYPTSFTDMTTSGSLQVPSGVTVTGGGMLLQGNGWTLALASGNPPTLACSSATSPYGAALAATAPNAWWVLDTAGPTFADSAGSASLTASGAAAQTLQTALAPGTGPSVCFTATGSNLATASGIQTNATALSVAGWVKVPVGNGSAVLYQNRGPVGANQRGVSVTVGNGQIRWGMDTDGVFIGLYSTSTINDGQAHHVAGTWNGTVWTIYIDGVAAGTTTVTGWAGPFSSNQPSSIGYHAAWGVSSVGSCISDVAVWNRTLSSTEVATLAAAGR